ncbi:MAG TPA: hypothetical protein VFQ35_10695 [Polyangiaceae bacterium]|nr:hypothetical protein [Polyangiaceae bacterium]
MFRSRFSVLALTLSTLAACGGASGSARIGEDPVSRKTPPSVRARAPEHSEADSDKEDEDAPEAAPATPAASAQEPPTPTYDATQVRAAVDATAAAPDERTRLGVRLAVVEQGPDAPWLIAVVNRGTEPVRVVHDLRTLNLEVTPPAPEPDPKKKAKPRAPKPVTCALPRGIVPSEEEKTLELTLEPGEGLIDSFDPRLYCLPTAGKSVLTEGASVVARLGWQEKTRAVWTKGKKVTRVLEQSAPFVARRVRVAGSLPEAEEPKTKVEKDDPASEPKSDREAVKQLVAAPISLGEAYAPQKPPPSDSLDLVLTRGSDASTERDATISVSLVNHSKKAERVLFRRESLTFEVSGPDGLVACEPGPDNRAPDRSSIALLKPGRRLSSTSRLIELCPQGAMRRPGLYLVHARFDGLKGGDSERPPTFAGRVVSREPVAIRVRRGWGEMPAQRQPERVRVGTP